VLVYIEEMEMNRQDSEPKYVISVAARIVGIETHTLRYYEKLGLVQPYRSQGKIRYYSESDIEQLKHVKTLIIDLGVNPAGVEVAIRMAQTIVKMQAEIQELSNEIDNLKQSHSGAIEKSGTTKKKPER
jgi:MerR family transcriptional regulator, heat shock protein HspR